MTDIKRLISLDAFRGFTIAAMITVNFPGTWDHVYAPLRHSLWNGLTPTDLIAPFFLFIVGISIAFAYTKRIESGVPKKDMIRKIVIRALKIYLVGLFLNLLPDFNFVELRYTGTLARISIVFLFCAILFLYSKWKVQAWIGILILVVYWLVMTLIPTPGYGTVMLERGANLAAWIDENYMPGVLWQGNWDPEGILSTFPSLVTGITGLLAGRILLDKTLGKQEKSINLMIGGLFSTALGYLWGLTFPVNENIWTSSFVLVTSGMAAMLMGAIFFLVDIKGRTKGTKPGIIFGANAITVYVLGDVLGLFFYSLRIGGNSLNMHFFDAFTSLGLAPKFVSMTYSLIFICINFIPAYILYKKKIFIKL
jgi:predicted acyltransferase